MTDNIINEHNKQEYPPMHTAEHLLNGEIARRYGCGRAFSAHIITSTRYQDGVQRIVFKL